MNEEIVRLITCFILGWDIGIYKDCIIIDIKDACRTKKDPIVLADIFLLLGLFILIATVYSILAEEEISVIFVVLFTVYAYMMKFALKE